MAAMKEASTPSEAHTALKAYVGTWKAEIKEWMPGNPEPRLTKGISINKLILGGRFLEQKYVSTAKGEKFEGQGIIGYDNLAKKYGITREQQDAYVVGSQQRVAAAKAAGKYAEEIVPFTTTMKVTDKATKQSHTETVTLDHDEGPRPDTTLEGLAALKPVFPGGTTTAGNASQLSDGAAAVVMMDADLAQKRGLPILGLFRGMQLAAVPPEEMSIAIAPAIRCASAGKPALSTANIQ